MPPETVRVLCVTCHGVLSAKVFPCRSRDSNLLASST